jgi:LPS-assembly protein
VFITRHWGVSVYGVRDLEAGAWRQRDLGLIYQDDCTRVEIVYRHGETFNRTLGPSESVVIRLTLATFGNSRYGR